MSATSMPRERGIALRDVLMFLAVSNFHYPLFALVGIEYSAGMLPLPAVFIVTGALLSGRLSAVFAMLPYVIAGALYFVGLGLIGVPYDPVGAYVTTMQTATMIAFLQYLLSLGPAGARDVISNVQKLVGAYLILFTFIAFGIRLSGSVDLYNQVASSNYVGMLTTYFILSVMRREWVSRGQKTVTAMSLLVNILGRQRASLLINLFIILRRYVFGRRGRLIVLIVTMVVAYLVFSYEIKTTIAALITLIRQYSALAMLDTRDLETIIRRSVNAPQGYDASALIRVFSMWYLAGEIIANPMSPVATREFGSLWNSHNLFLEYFKVGGLIFVVLSFVALFRRCRELIDRGYCRVSRYGVVLALIYTMLFNDLFIGFFLLALSFDRPWERARDSRTRF